jgi:hypothetical protein
MGDIMFQVKNELDGPSAEPTAMQAQSLRQLTASRPEAGPDCVFDIW